MVNLDYVTKCKKGFVWYVKKKIEWQIVWINNNIITAATFPNLHPIFPYKGNGRIEHFNLVYFH